MKTKQLTVLALLALSLAAITGCKTTSSPSASSAGLSAPRVDGQQAREAGLQNKYWKVGHAQ